MDIKTLIGNSPRTDGSSTVSKPRGAPSSAAAEPSTPATSSAVGESVTLTETAKTLSVARETAQNVPFDSARVAEIKTAISEGRYPIDTRRLAENMLNFERLLA